MLVTTTPISRPGSLWPAASGDATLRAWACDLAEWRKEIPAQQTSLNLQRRLRGAIGILRRLRMSERR